MHVGSSSSLQLGMPPTTLKNVSFALAAILTQNVLGGSFCDLLFSQDCYYFHVVWYSETFVSTETTNTFSLETQAMADSWTWLKG